MSRRILLGLVAVLTALAVACLPTENLSVEPREAGVEQWRCGDRFDGCLLMCPVTLTANTRAGMGEVRFSGTVERTRFEIHGLERRWDWCLKDNGFECAFVISADGGGRYYNFRGSAPDKDGQRSAKPTDLFKCSRM